MRNYHTDIVGFNRIMNAEANNLYRILTEGDWNGFIEYNKTIENEEDRRANIEYFILLLLLAWSFKTTILNISKVVINHNIQVTINAIKSQVKDKQILKDFIADQQLELNDLSLRYLDTVDIKQLQMDMSKAIANKVDEVGAFVEISEVEKSLWGALGIVIPIISGLTYTKITTGDIKDFKLPKYFDDAKKVGVDPVDQKLVISNQWSVARPLDYDCYSVAGEVREVGKKFSNGRYNPPVHKNCWLDGQTILTKNGWKPVQDITLNDEVLTLDNNYNTTFAHPVAVWHKKVSEIITHQGKTARFAFTPEHKMIDVSDYNAKYNKSKRIYRFTEIGSFTNKSYNLLQSAYNDRKDLNISDLEISFLAWYIGEGSKGIYRNFKKKQIFIAQSLASPVRKIFEDDIKNFVTQFDPKAKIWICKTGIEIRSDKLFDWLPDGKSPVRRCPEKLLYMSKRQSRLFITKYSLGDGYTLRDTYFDDYKCNDSILLFTSSPKLLADISIIVQNAEWNVAYVQYMGTWTIRVKTSRNYYLETKNLERLHGNFSVTGIQLEHGNKVLSCMDGRCVWTHNCMCTLKPYLVSKKGIQKLIKKYTKNG